MNTAITEYHFLVFGVQMGDPSSIFTGFFKITGALGPGTFHLGGDIAATPLKEGTDIVVNPQRAVEAGVDFREVSTSVSH